MNGQFSNILYSALSNIITAFIDSFVTPFFDLIASFMGLGG